MAIHDLTPTFLLSTFVEQKAGSAHAWGVMKCPHNKKCGSGNNCLNSIWSTPKNTGNFARLIKKMVDSCSFTEANTKKE